MIGAPGVWRIGHVGMVAGIGPLGHGQLAQRHRARGLQPVHDRRVERRDEAAVNGRAGGGRRKGGIAEILYRDRNPMQRTFPDPLGNLRVCPPCLIQRTFPAQVKVALEPGIKIVDAPEHFFGNGNGGDLPIPDHPRHRGKAPEMDPVRGHLHLPVRGVSPMAAAIGGRIGAQASRALVSRGQGVCTCMPEVTHIRDFERGCRPAPG